MLPYVSSFGGINSQESLAVVNVIFVTATEFAFEIRSRQSIWKNNRHFQDPYSPVRTFRTTSLIGHVKRSEGP